MQLLLIQPPFFPNSTFCLGQLTEAEQRMLRQERSTHFPANLRGENVTLERLSQHKSARLCLQNALKAQINEETLPEWWQLEQNNYAELTQFPEIQASLAHTSGPYATAWISTRKSPLGIDIEKSDRPIRKNTDRYFLQEKENRLKEKFHLLELWSLKEACFKAASPHLENDDLLLKHLILNPDHTFSFENTLLGHWHLEKTTFINQTFYLSFAWIL